MAQFNMDEIDYVFVDSNIFVSSTLVVSESIVYVDPGDDLRIDRNRFRKNYRHYVKKPVGITSTIEAKRK